MDDSPHRRPTEHNKVPVQRLNSENMDYVGITITDDFSQKELPPLPVMSTVTPQRTQQSRQSRQSQQFQPQQQHSSQHQEPPIIYQRRKSDIYVQHPSQQNYSSSPSTLVHLLPHQHRQSQQRDLSSQTLRPSQAHHPQLINPPGQLHSQGQRPSHSQSPSCSYQPNSQQAAPPINHYHITYTAKSSQLPIIHLRKDYDDSKHDHRGTAFRHIRSKSDMYPPTFRRIDSKEYISPLKSLTVKLSSTYHRVNPNFRYELSYNPRRVLTKPSKGVKNDGYDNEDSDYILYVNDILGSEEGQKYLIMDILGQGTFGQVVKCLNLKTKEVVAVKVVKNKPAYFNQSMMEVAILELLNQTWDTQDEHHILRLRDTFIHKKHLCLVFELLSVNLYELIKQNQFRGLSTNLVRVFTSQLLDALTVLNEARIIHCDLKPENILLKNLESPTIKVIDFGSACHERQTVYTYIQSRFYRSPEVLLGLPYSSAIDMWSLGCIAAELFLGLPLFPGSSEYNQVSRIVEMLGVPPVYMIEVGKTAHEYFERCDNEHGQKKYRLKTMEQYMREHNSTEQPSKKYFSATKLPDIIQNYPITRKGMTQKDNEKEMQNRLAFIDFIQGLLNLNPIERWSPQQAKLHPFITGEKFTGKFTPPMQLKSSKPSATSQIISAPPIAHQSSTEHLSPMSSQTNTSASSKTGPKKVVVSADNLPGTTPSQQSSTQRLSGQNGKQSNLTARSSIGSLNRPRASTIGNVQIPPQIQRAAALVSPGRAPREKDPRRLPQHYPHLNFLNEQDSLESSPFSVVVDGDDRHTHESNDSSRNTDAFGIRITDEWAEMKEVQRKERKYHINEKSPKDERYQTATSNDDTIKRGGEVHSIISSNNEKRFRGDGGIPVGMPGAMPGGLPGMLSNGSPGSISGRLDDNNLGPTVLPLHQYQKQLPSLGNDAFMSSQYTLPLPSVSLRPSAQQSINLRHPSPLPSTTSPIVNNPTRPSPSYSTYYNSPSSSPYASHPLPSTSTQNPLSIHQTQSNALHQITQQSHHHHQHHYCDNLTRTPETSPNKNNLTQQQQQHRYSNVSQINTMP